jgi:hypothetical protein
MEFNIDIDFDEASAAWMKNKRSIGYGSYKYCCTEFTKSGEKCKNKPLQDSSFCHIHKKRTHTESRVS